jgi:hypothetical protein
MTELIELYYRRYPKGLWPEYLIELPAYLYPRDQDKTRAPGNQPTEKLVLSFHSLGVKTGLDEKKVFSLAQMVQRELYSKIPLTNN